MPDVTTTVSTSTTHNNNKPNNLQGAPKTSDKLIAMGTMALNAAPVLAAPLLPQTVNPAGAGGLAVTMIGNGIGVIVQGLAAQDWYDDYKWAVWTCVGLSVAVCGALYIVVLGNPELGVLNSLGTMYQATTSYGPLNKLGVFSRPGDVPSPEETEAEIVKVENVEVMEVSAQEKEGIDG